MRSSGSRGRRRHAATSRATIELIARARELPVDPNARRQLDAEWFALHHEGPAGAALRGYFFAPPGRGIAPELGAARDDRRARARASAHYLLGLQKANSERVAGARPRRSTRASTLGLPAIAFTKNARAQARGRRVSRGRSRRASSARSRRCAARHERDRSPARRRLGAAARVRRDRPLIEVTTYPRGTASASGRPTRAAQLVLVALVGTLGLSHRVRRP